MEVLIEYLVQSILKEIQIILGQQDKLQLWEQKELEKLFLEIRILLNKHRNINKNLQIL
jgi:hypothetical protein